MIEIVQPGLCTMVQDGGRWGAHAHGIGPAGAADWVAAELANLLVDNARGDAVLECTITGPHFLVHHDTWMAITGAPCAVRLAPPGLAPLVLPADGEPARVHHLRAGTLVQIGAAQRGCRMYVAFRGGITLPPLLGSRSALRRAGIDGPAGRALVVGDRLPLASHPQPPRERSASLVDAACAAVQAQVVHVAAGDQPILLRVMPAAPDAGTPDVPSTAWQGVWQVSSRSDRMGVRLVGAPLVLDAPAARSSEPVTTGTIQLPPDGQPIILLNDRQTTGGYPVLGHVCTADLPRVAQLPPHARLRLHPISVQAAHALLRSLTDPLDALAAA